MAPRACSPSCVACQIYGRSHDTEYNAIADASGGLLASFVDSVLRWKTPDGPGVKVGGQFHFIQAEKTRDFVLYAKEKFSSAGVLRRDGNDSNVEKHDTLASDKEPRVPSSGALSERFREQVVQTAGHSGTFLPDIYQEARDEISNTLEEEFYRRFVQAGITSRDKFTAVDVSGQIDIDYDSPGPVLKPIGQRTFSGYLSTFNTEEFASKGRRERRRMLALLPTESVEDESELDQEIRGLKRSGSVSSVSDVSVDQDHDIEEFSACGDDCWLKSHHRDIDTIRLESSRSSILEMLKHSSDPATSSKSALPGQDKDLVAGERYQYSKLPNGYTRLLSLHAAVPGAAVECSLLPHLVPWADTLTKPNEQPYEALSYTWGGQKSTHAILCNGKTVLVTGNLHTALMQLRQVDKNRLIWIDAVCINQADTAEKSRQIPLMIDIYRAAKNVVVWLGECAADSSFAVAGMKFMDTSDGRKKILQMSHDKRCIRTLQRQFNAQVAFFSRPWFQRTWIRQEISMAKKVSVFCGPSEVSWYTMKRSVKRLDRIHAKLEESDFSTISDDQVISRLKYLTRGWVYGQNIQYNYGEIRSIWYYHTGGLLDLLMVGREFDATDPRDKVYAVLGMARVPMRSGREDYIHPRRAPPGASDTDEMERMEVDYSKSVSEVYQHLVKYIINRDRNLDILGILSTHRGSTSADLPSWVPDWRVPTTEISVRKHGDYFTSKFGAGGFTEGDRQDQYDLGRLLVQGWPADEVATLMPFTSDLPSPPLVPHVEVRPYDSSRDLRRMCQTSDSRTAIVPNSARPGDEIYVLQGSRLPMVLRACPGQEIERDADGRIIDYTLEFEVVGPGWCGGLMYGEAIESYQQRKVEPLKIILV